MTNPTDQEKIDGAKLIVEFMDGWEWLDSLGFHEDSGFFPGDGKHPIIAERLWTDRNIQHEIIEAFSTTQMTCFIEQIQPKEPHGLGAIPYLYTRTHLLADTETVFVALVETIKESD